MEWSATSWPSFTVLGHREQSAKAVPLRNRYGLDSEVRAVSGDRSSAVAGQYEVAFLEKKNTIFLSFFLQFFNETCLIH